jgi:hypothetical protein
MRYVSTSATSISTYAIPWSIEVPVPKNVNSAINTKREEIENITTPQRRVKRKYSCGHNNSKIKKNETKIDNVEGFRSKRKKAGFSLPSLVGAGAGAGDWASTTAGERMASSRPKIATTPITAIEEDEKEPAIFSPLNKKKTENYTNNKRLHNERERERK